MSNQYGPWATMIDLGGRPQLSSFWRRRLTMLVSVSQTGTALSRRNRFWLAATAIVMLVVPTFHSTLAAADPQGPPDESGATRENRTTTKRPQSPAKPTENQYSGETSVASGTLTVAKTPEGGTMTVGGPLEDDMEVSPSHPNDLDFPFYQPLLNPRTRGQLYLSGEQEKKLRELNRRYKVGLGSETRKLLIQANNLPSKEREAKQKEIMTQLREKAKSLRKEVESLLTAEQLRELQDLVLSEQDPLGLLLTSPKCALTPEQTEEISRLGRLQSEYSAQAYQKTLQLKRANDEKAIAVLTPKQLRSIERRVADGDSGRPVIFGQQLSFQFTTPPGVGHAAYPLLWEIRQQLKLTEEQLAKLNAISVESKASQDLYKLSGKNHRISGFFGASGSVTTTGEFYTSNASSRDRHKPTSPEVRQKWDDLKKQFFGEIEAVLMPDQRATLKKTALRKSVAAIVRNLWAIEDAEVHISKAQAEQLRQLSDERCTADWRLCRSAWEDTLKALPSDLREKCMQEEERRGWWW